MLNNLNKLILTVLAIIAGILPTFSQDTESYAFQRAMEECRNGETASAIEWFNKELEEHPNNGYASLFLATIFGELDEYGKALTSVNPLEELIS